MILTGHQLLLFWVYFQVKFDISRLGRAIFNRTTVSPVVGNVDSEYARSFRLQTQIALALLLPYDKLGWSQYYCYAVPSLVDKYKIREARFIVMILLLCNYCVVWLTTVSIVYAHIFIFCKVWYLFSMR